MVRGGPWAHLLEGPLHGTVDELRDVRGGQRGAAPRPCATPHGTDGWGLSQGRTRALCVASNAAGG